METIVSTSSRFSSGSVDVAVASSSSGFHEQEVDAEVRSPEPESGSRPEQQHRRLHNRHRQRPRNLQNNRFGSYQLNTSPFEMVPDAARNGTCSVIFVIFSIWIFACMTVILGFYGPSTIQFGPNSSLLIKVSPFFVQSVQVNEIDDAISGSTVYGFDKLPSLDVNFTWSESRDACIESGDHKAWPFFLNKGSKIHISYNIKRPTSAGLAMIIAEGSDNVSDWIEDRLYANTTLPWFIVHVGNFIFEKVEVQLNYTLISTVYNTSQASYNCTLRHDVCTLKLNLFGPNAVVITSPGPELATASYKWNVKLSYGQRWMSYILGSVSVAVLILIVTRILNFCMVTRGSAESIRVIITDERSSLIATEYGISSPSYSEDSISNDEDDLNEPILDAKKQQTVEHCSNNDGRNLLCITCSDAFRDSFFLPCGHCAECFTCGTRTIEERGGCPVCSRLAKKVRKIFIV